MGLGKTYSTKYLLDSNNNSGVAGQVLSTTSTGIDWADANTLPGAGLWLANGNDIYNSNSGNVGIGTTLPLSLSANTSSLSVNSTRTDLTGGLFLKANDVSKVQLYWATSGFINEILSGSCLWYTNNALKMELLAGDASQLTLKAKSGTYGQAAILRLEGTNSSTYGGTVIADSTITSFTDGTAYGAHLTFGLNNTSNVVTERMRITSAGALLVNRTSSLNGFHTIQAAVSYTHLTLPTICSV